MSKWNFSFVFIIFVFSYWFNHVIYSLAFLYFLLQSLSFQSFPLFDKLLVLFFIHLFRLSTRKDLSLNFIFNIVFDHIRLTRKKCTCLTYFIIDKMRVLILLVFTLIYYTVRFSKILFNLYIWKIRLLLYLWCEVVWSKQTANFMYHLLVLILLRHTIFQ